jgi:hypothetical protein
VCNALHDTGGSAGKEGGGKPNNRKRFAACSAVDMVRRWLLSWVVFLVGVTCSLVASAADPVPTASTSSFAGYASLDVGVRSLRLDGTELRSRTAGSTLAVQGADLPTKALFDTNVRFGFRFHGFLAGVGAGFGYADWGGGKPQPLGDIVVRPNGFLVSGAVLTSAGYRYERGGYAARAEGVLGAEIVGIGFERPSFPDTKIPYANGVRPYLAHRITLERAFDDVSFGLFAQVDVTTPGNVYFGISITPWGRP